MSGRIKVIFTRHALRRAFEIGLPWKNKKKLREIFLRAKRDNRNISREFYKLSKYGVGNEKITYWSTKKLRFTVAEKEDRQVIITISKKKSYGQRQREKRRKEVSEMREASGDST